jgi:hypothetical protein
MGSCFSAIFGICCSVPVDAYADSLSPNTSRQFVTMPHERIMNDYWSDDRFSPPIVDYGSTRVPSENESAQNVPQIAGSHEFYKNFTFPTHSKRRRMILDTTGHYFHLVPEETSDIK